MEVFSGHDGSNSQNTGEKLMRSHSQSLAGHGDMCLSSQEAQIERLWSRLAQA
jgi:hypothetical protein